MIVGNLFQQAYTIVDSAIVGHYNGEAALAAVDASSALTTIFICVAIGGGTYVHNIPGGVAFGAGDMEFDSHLHGANERARVSALMQAARIYANVIVELCGEDA